MNDGNDYINASWISAHGVPFRHISAQGPLPETVPHFWQMVFEEHAPAIVMLTRTVERGQVRPCRGAPLPLWAQD